MSMSIHRHRPGRKYTHQKSGSIVFCTDIDIGIFILGEMSYGLEGGRGV
jgi:hypothetical protein